jgi:uncharacterized protein YciI
MSDAEPTIEALLGRMLRKPYYAVRSRLVGAQDEMRAHLRDHLLYMIDLEARGLLFASGPLVDERDRGDGSGLTILRADSLAKADELARQDPMVVAGVRAYEISRWLVNEGAVTVTVRASNGSASLG